MNNGPLDFPLGCRVQPSRSGWFPAHTIGRPGLIPSVKCFGLAYFLSTELFLVFCELVFVLFGLVWFSILFNVSKRNLLLAANKFGHLHLSLSAKSTSIQSFLQAGIEGKETPLPGSGLIILPALNSGTSLLPCGGLGNKDISQHYEAGFFLLAFTKHVQHIHSAPLHLSLPLSP